MKRLVAIVALGAALIAVVVVLLTSRSGKHEYEVRAIFDNAGFVIPGEDVKVAGVKVGKIDKLEVTPDNKAAVVLKITDSGYQDFRRDASCIVRPQSLIGERFVECTPTQKHPVDQSPPPPLRRITAGPGEGQYLLPVTNTLHTVDIDLIGNTMRLPERQRLSLILNELGVGLAGRGKDLNEVIRRANPALESTDRVLQILAQQNRVLTDLAVNSDRVLAPLARDRARVASAIRNTSAVNEAVAERRGDLEADLRRLPRFLDELKPTMERLSSVSDEVTPVLSDLHAAAPDVNRLIRDLGPFSDAATPAVESLGDASKIGTPAMIKSRPVIAQLRDLANSIRPIGATGAALLESFQKTEGINRLMDYIFYQVTSINGFDAFGHYLRAGLIVNQCSSYAVDPVPGCSANFTQSASATTAGAAGPRDPVLAATRAALRSALSGKPTVSAKRSARHPAKAKHDARERGANRRGANGGEVRTAVRGAAPAAGRDAPEAGGAGAAATATPGAAAGPPAAHTPAPSAGGGPASPQEALLDYLFGSDGG